MECLFALALRIADHYHLAGAPKDHLLAGVELRAHEASSIQIHQLGVVIDVGGRPAIDDPPRLHHIGEVGNG